MNPTITATTTISGPGLVLHQIDQELGRSKVLSKAFLEHGAEVLSLAWYVASTGKVLAHAGT